MRRPTHRRAPRIAMAICGERCWKLASNWRATADPMLWCCVRRRAAPALSPTRPTGTSPAATICSRRCARRRCRRWPLRWRPNSAGGAAAGGPPTSRRAGRAPAGPPILAAAKTGKSGLDPFQLLGAALDRLVAAGVLPPERRPGAEYLAWSAVHGLAMLVLDGPLHRLTRAQQRTIGQRLLDMVEQGL